MSEAAREKFNSATPPLTNRLTSRGTWDGTCSDFVQMGIEDLPAVTVVALMIISSGDPKRQIRDRLMASDKAMLGVAVGKYKSQHAVSITLATTFVANGPTETEEQQFRERVLGEGAAPEEPSREAFQAQEDAAAEAARLMSESARPANNSEDEMEAIQRERMAKIAAMEGGGRSQVVEFDSDDEQRQVQQERLAKIAALEKNNSRIQNQTNSPGGVVTYDSDEEVAAMQRERMAKLAALERGYHNAPEQQVPDDDDDHSSLAGTSAAAARAAPDVVTMNWREKQEQERKQREEEERQRREAIEAAEAARKAKWQAERKAREEAKRKAEEERLARLQQQHERAQRHIGGIKSPRGTAPALSLRQTAPAATTAASDESSTSSSSLDNAFRSSETDPGKREEERLMRAMQRKGTAATSSFSGNIFGGGAAAAVRKVPPPAAAPIPNKVDNEAELRAAREKEARERRLAQEEKARRRKEEEARAAAEVAAELAAEESGAAAPAASSQPQQQEEEEELPTFGSGGAVPKDKGNIETAWQNLQSVSSGGLRLYLNALIRAEESIVIQSLDEVRSGVTFYTETAHQLVRKDKYTVVLDPDGEARALRLPSSDLIDDDFNQLSDYFCFGTADHLDLFLDSERQKPLTMSKLGELSMDTVYYLESGNSVELRSGSPPTLWLADSREIDLPEECIEELEEGN